MKYSHLCTIAFSLSVEQDADEVYEALDRGDEVTIREVLTALHKRIADVLQADELSEAIEIYDTVVE